MRIQPLPPLGPAMNSGDTWGEQPGGRMISTFLTAHSYAQVIVGPGQRKLSFQSPSSFQSTRMLRYTSTCCWRQLKALNATLEPVHSVNTTGAVTPASPGGSA